MWVSSSGRHELSWQAFVPVCVLRRYSPCVCSSPCFRGLSAELGGVINNHDPWFECSPHLVDGNGITGERSHKTWVFEGWWCESIDSSVSIWSGLCTHICQGKDRGAWTHAAWLSLLVKLWKSCRPNWNKTREMLSICSLYQTYYSCRTPYTSPLFGRIHTPAGCIDFRMQAKQTTTESDGVVSRKREEPVIVLWRWWWWTHTDCYGKQHSSEAL